MIGWFINFEIFQKYQSPTLASVFAFVFVVVVVVVAVVGVVIIIATIAVVVAYDNFFIGEGRGRVKDQNYFNSVDTGRIG